MWKKWKSKCFYLPSVPHQKKQQQTSIILITFPNQEKRGKKEEKRKETPLFSTCPSDSACYTTASWRNATSSPGAWRSLGTCVGKRRKPHRVDPLHGHPLQFGSKRSQKSWCFFLEWGSNRASSRSHAGCGRGATTPHLRALRRLKPEGTRQRQACRPRHRVTRRDSVCVSHPLPTSPSCPSAAWPSESFATPASASPARPPHGSSSPAAAMLSVSSASRKVMAATGGAPCFGSSGSAGTPWPLALPTHYGKKERPFVLLT